jgi:putative phosphoribosyl transferase
MLFRDRRDAGRQLARLVERFHGENTVVLGLARGGVPVAFEVARALGAPLDVFVARKLGAPGQPEFGIGAVAPGVRVVDARSVALVGATKADIDQIAADEEQEMERRLLAYRGGAAPHDVRGKTVILVDDGLATGVTARAAARSLRRMGPARLVLAVPVAAPESAAGLLPEVDELLVVEAHEDLRAVGVWYDDFSQTTDEEVISLLAEARRGRVAISSREVEISFDGRTLRADLTLTSSPRGLVVFAHGSGSSRLSPRNRHVAARLQREALATLLVDLLTSDEEEIDGETGELRFDIPFLARRQIGRASCRERVSIDV